jgi:hypothetical protein
MRRPVDGAENEVRFSCGYSDLESWNKAFGPLLAPVPVGTVIHKTYGGRVRSLLHSPISLAMRSPLR